MAPSTSAVPKHFDVPDCTQTKFDFHPTPALLTGRIVVVTGSNVGLGLWTAIHLCKLDPKLLILAVRTPSKGETAKKEIAEKSGLAADRIQVWELDLSSFDSVKAFAARVISSLPRLDILCENAGIASFDWQTTADGWEAQFQVNALSTGLLGVSLLPLLAKTAKLQSENGMKEFKPHLAIVGSGIHSAFTYEKNASAKSLLTDFNDPASPNAKERYAFTKLVDNYLARKISRLPDAQNVVVTAINPGLCISELVRNAPEDMKNNLRSKAMPTEEGAKNIAWASVADLKEKGAYIDKLAVAEPSPFSLSPEGLDLEDKLWKEMVDLWIKTEPSVKGVLAK
ncbi:hypothetical protein BDZ88DRAFT_499670 [Geranomyces variabilis]|nr:hypothetical protein BDZ88DRAFT_499670 [Geranomyces variabilis]KAJ3136007.1 hypothetical protein HDU90_003409 [Geranomyces variabilis]